MKLDKNELEVIALALINEIRRLEDLKSWMLINDVHANAVYETINSKNWTTALAEKVAEELNKRD